MKNLLIVDDEVDIASSLKDYLSDKGFSIQTCHTADEAFSSFCKSAPDLILSDIKMPGRTGLDLFAMCKKEEAVKKAQIPFVLMTAYSDIIGVEKAFDMGVSELLAKPFDYESLNLVLNYLLKLDSSFGSADDKYFPVDIHEILQSNNSNFDIYLKIADKYVLVAKSGQEFSEQRLKNYLKKGVDSIYMKSN